MSKENNVLLSAEQEINSQSCPVCGRNDNGTRIYIRTCPVQCCPVCDGKGLVSNGFYTDIPMDIPLDIQRMINIKLPSSTNNPEKCRSCDGRGYIWR
jgi:hypothetical protein